MERYEKPSVLMNEELAEGVYAASGAVDGGSDEPGSVSVTSTKQTGFGHEYNKVNTYAVTITNSTNEEATDWSVTFALEEANPQSAVIYNNWLASASLSGRTVTITPGGGGAISAGGSIEVEVVVTYI